MQENGSGWQDFLCENHSRNLHFDAINRQYTQYINGLLGEDMDRANLKSGGRLRIKPDGESFVRAIHKLTHIGPKQYEKGNLSTTPNLHLHSIPHRNPHFHPKCRRWHCIPGLLQTTLAYACKPVCRKGGIK